MIWIIYVNFRSHFLRMKFGLDWASCLNIVSDNDIDNDEGTRAYAHPINSLRLWKAKNNMHQSSASLSFSMHMPSISILCKDLFLF